MISIFIAAYILAVGIGIYVCSQLFPFTGGTDGTKNFTAAATLVVAAISGVMTAIVGLFTLHRNLDSQFRIKHLEDELLNKRDFTKNTKDAYLALLAAATTAYSLLEKMAGEEWLPANKTTMEAVFLKALPQLVYCRRDEHRKAWLVVQQRSTFLAESAADMTTKAEQSELWRKKNAAFSEAVAKFEKFAQEEIRRGTELEQKF